VSNTIIRPNARFVFLEISTDENLVESLSKIDEFVKNSKDHLYAHHYNILLKKGEIKKLGRDIIGPIQRSGELPDGLKCSDIKASNRQKVILNSDIYELSLDNIEKIADDTVRANELKSDEWELWWSSKEEDNPFFLF
jgi:hypothetical protein